MSESCSRSCIYCGGRTKLTLEHAIPQWLVEKAPDEYRDAAHEFMYPAQFPDALELGPKALSREGSEKRLWVDYATRRLCGACNNGWAADLQTHAQRLIGNLVFAKGPISYKFSSEDQVWLGLWAWHTVLTIAAFKREDDFFPPAWYRLCAKNGMPNGVAVELMPTSYMRFDLCVFGLLGAVRGPVEQHVAGRVPKVEAPLRIGLFRFGRLVFRVSHLPPGCGWSV
jgi:hypothetical protein